jgi:hypothetical protein
MLAKGMNLAEVKELMGHEDVKTTMKYLHPNAGCSAAVVNQRNHSKSLHILKATGLTDSHIGLWEANKTAVTN